jgi:hypothetical protein
MVPFDRSDRTRTLTGYPTVILGDIRLIFALSCGLSIHYYIQTDLPGINCSPTQETGVEYEAILMVSDGRQFPTSYNNVAALITWTPL